MADSWIDGMNFSMLLVCQCKTNMYICKNHDSMIP